MATRRKALGGFFSALCMGGFRGIGFAAKTAGSEYHVAKNGNDGNTGSRMRPLSTISEAARRAVAGDTVTVHAGVYRERIDPLRGGTSDAKRIVYQAAAGERVEISGAEVVTGWQHVGGDVWSVEVPNSLFGAFHPFRDVIHGDWFNPLGRVHHTGAVYLNGQWLDEAAKQEDVFQPARGNALWYSEVGDSQTRLWAQFKDKDPNRELTEINARQTVFYASRPGINYITVRGFSLCKAATPWAPPTAEQIGLIGPHWAKGWVIEDNVVRHSICCGISLGKYGDRWDNTSQDSATGYVETIQRALANGWTRAQVGSHVVRRNTVSHCEQAGIVGSLGAIFSSITENCVHDVHVKRLFTGAEMAGIKIHAAIDTEVRGNHVFRTAKGMWFDWMAQGTRITANVFHDNREDLMLEVNHGPFVVDNNLFFSGLNLNLFSQGGAFAHNLFCGGIKVRLAEARVTPYMKPHSTEIAGMHDNPSGDMRFYNNLFAQHGDLSSFDKATLPMSLKGNVFLAGSKPCVLEMEPLIRAESDPGIRVVGDAPDGIAVTLNRDWSSGALRPLVTTGTLPRPVLTNLPFEDFNGKVLQLNRDFCGRRRDEANAFPGPFEFVENARFGIPSDRQG